ncbi:MAG TPA: histidine kinase [Thermoanaerobaculia bacterium]|nr:histidine kinase [Thermoanaerobaculia bacterium]
MRYGRLLLLAAGDLFIWILAGLFATSEFYRRSIVMGGGVAVAVHWNEILNYQMVTALNWALFTPLVVLLAQRLPLRPPHRLRNAAIVIALILPLSLIRVAWGAAMINYGEGEALSAALLVLSMHIRLHRYIIIFAAIFFVYYLVDAQREAAKRERQRVRARALLARTEIDALRMRLQPQFALRMLRHIGSVLRADPRAADGLIVTLSGILRRSMARGNDERIPLADELEHFDHCLDLCRAGDRFSVSARYLAGDDVLACRVPPLVLQPLIESVVLDLTTGAGGSVEVHCARENDEACVEVSWTVAPDGPATKYTNRIPCQEAPV